MMKPIVNLTARNDVKKAKKAKTNIEEKRMQLADKSHQLRQKIDRLSEELTEAHVQFEMDEISEAELTEVKKKHEAAQIALIEHEKRIEPVDKAAKRLEQQFNDTWKKATIEELPTVVKERNKRAQAVLDAMDTLETANNQLYTVNHGLAHSLKVDTKAINFRAVQMNNGSTSWDHYKHNLQTMVK